MMRLNTFSLIASLMLSAGPAFTQVEPADDGAEAIVTLQLTGMDDEAWQRVMARIGRERGTNMEYVCQRAGILVLRSQQLSVREKADVMTLVRRLLDEAGIHTPVEFLHVYLERQTWNKC